MAQRLLADEALWQQVEYGSYTADLPGILKLAELARGPVLDLGAGVGRVSIQLARQGHEVTALDNDAAVLEALSRHADELGLAVHTELGDATSFELDRRFALIAAPMQLVQLFGPAERRSLLGSAAAHLESGGKVAISILDDDSLELYADQPIPDMRESDSWVLSSTPLEVTREAGEIVIRLLRQTVSPDGELEEIIHEDRLAVIDTDTVAVEAREAGLVAVAVEKVPRTELHAASLMVVLEAANA
jgi:cyclopropane fatty-acyl-phospholipid synthase-like methyltransferase